MPWNAPAIFENVRDLLVGGKTLCERRCGEPLKGPIIPFGAMVELYPISAGDQSTLYQFGHLCRKDANTMFTGYSLLLDPTFWNQLNHVTLSTATQGFAQRSASERVALTSTRVCAVSKTTETSGRHTGNDAFIFRVWRIVEFRIAARIPIHMRSGYAVACPRGDTSVKVLRCFLG